MNTQLSIGQTYIYGANGYTMEVEYIGPFLDRDGLGGWHDFLIKSSTQKGRISMPGVCLAKEAADTEIITISGDIVNSRQLTAKSQPETKIVSNALIPVEPSEPVEIENTVTLTAPVKPSDTDIAAYQEVGDQLDMKIINIAFTKGGRSVTHSIQGACSQNAVYHAYSYLYKEFHRGASDVRVYMSGECIRIENIREFTPSSLFYFLISSVV